MYPDNQERHPLPTRRNFFYFGYSLKNLFNTDLSTLFSVKFLREPNSVNKLIFQRKSFLNSVRFGGVFFICLFLFSACNRHHFSEDHSHKSQNKTKIEKVEKDMNNIQKTDSTLPYRQIPDAPEDYASGNVISRMIDGLGYRYYWATEGLTEKDLAYRPSESGRTSYETLEHIFGLSETIVNAPQNKPNIRPSDWSDLTFLDLREKTLKNIKLTSDLFRGKKDADIAEMKIIFESGGKTSEYPFWNMLNGPIGDALWHTGQIVMLRRASGNPLPKGVSVFRGRTKE